LRLLAGERLAGPLRDQLALLLGEAGVKVEDERIDIGAELGHDKRDPVGHESAHEVHVSAQPIELRHDHRALGAPRRGERAGEFRAAIQRVGTLARLDLGVLADDVEALVSAKRRIASLCASIPRPQRPWLGRLTR